MWEGRDDQGVTIFRTKGDANVNPDPWRFSLSDTAHHATPRLVVPYVGYVFAALSLRPVRMLLIGVPALLVGVFAARSLWRDPQPRTTPS
jgi:signal peptidase